MKAIVQRVLSANVTVERAVVSSISKGLLVFAAVAPDDDEKDMATMARKILAMKIWDGDDGGRWKKNVLEIGGEILCVSQFTLLASTKKNKPDFHGAMEPQNAKRLYEILLQKLGEGYNPEKVKDGVFQAMMQVGLVNDGPVTLELNTPPKQVKQGKKVPPSAAPVVTGPSQEPSGAVNSNSTTEGDIA